jgi:hypothetical protein
MQVNKFFIYILCLSLFGIAEAFAQEHIQQLFYCNSTYNISKLWLLDDNTALGTRTENRQTSYVRDIVLIKNGLFVDSLSLNQVYGTTRDYRLSHIDEIIFYKPNQYLVICGNLTLPIKIEENKIHIQHIPRSRLQVSHTLAQEYPYLELHSIGKIENYLVGYYRNQVDKKRHGISNHDDKNFPEFWIAYIENETVTKILKINQKEEKVTEDLFIDIKDWEMVSLRTNTFQKFYSYHGNKIFFNVPRANKCYIYDIENKKIRVISFPYVEKNESCFYYYDYIAEKDYFVKKKKKSTYEIFQLSPSLTSAYLLKEIDFFPHAIVNGKIHQIREEKEGKNNFKCHYLVPIIENNSEENKVNILKEITIQIK